MFTERAEHIQQPAHGQGRGRLESQLLAVAAKSLTRHRQALEPLRQLLRQGAAGFRHLDPGAMAVKEFALEPGLQGLDMATDGARRHVQRGCRLAEGAEPGRGFKRTQRVERGKGHRSISM